MPGGCQKRQCGTGGLGAARFSWAGTACPTRRRVAARPLSEETEGTERGGGGDRLVHASMRATQILILPFRIGRGGDRSGAGDHLRTRPPREAPSKSIDQKMACLSGHGAETYAPWPPRPPTRAAQRPASVLNQRGRHHQRRRQGTHRPAKQVALRFWHLPRAGPRHMQGQRPHPLEASGKLWHGARRAFPSGARAFKDRP